MDNLDQRRQVVDLSYMSRLLAPLGDWVEDAACAQLGAGADVFTADNPDDDETALAVRVCRACPVRQACASYAAEGPVWGLWAGRWHGRRGKAKTAA